jgi:hypothetical protein
MIAKIVPYIGIAYVQGETDPGVSIVVFQLLIRGSIGLLTLALGLFNLAFGFTISTLARQPAARRSSWHSSRFCRRSCCRAFSTHSTACDLGAMDRRGADPTRSSAVSFKRQHRCRSPTQPVADRGLHADRCGDRKLLLPREGGLKSTGGSFALRAGRSGVGATLSPEQVPAKGMNPPDPAVRTGCR